MTEEKPKPNCYTCRHRGEIPGDCHSRCLHPAIGQQNDNPFGAMVDMMRGRTVDAAKALNIRGNPIGIKRGWFFWPANFDPTWLENCDGYEAKP